MIKLTNVSKTYRQGKVEVTALKSVSLNLPDGTPLIIMGPSGSGKSTLLQLIGALDKPNEGSLEVDGKDVSKMNDKQRSFFRRDTIGFVFQQFYLQPFLSAIDNVALPMRLKGVKAHQSRQRAQELLEKVGLSGKMHTKPTQLSGGEMQRVAIARALVNSPKLLLADEPTGNLDRANADEVVKIFKQLSQEGVTVVIVTHDEKVAESFPYIIKIEDGQVTGTNQ